MKTTPPWILIALYVLVSFIIISHYSAMVVADCGNSGFISIDCGARTDYEDEETGFWYQTEENFIGTGNNDEISSAINFNNDALTASRQLDIQKLSRGRKKLLQYPNFRSLRRNQLLGHSSMPAVSYFLYRDDVYDRLWVTDACEQDVLKSADAEVSAKKSDYKLPTELLSTASQPWNDSNLFTVNWPYDISKQYYLFLHFAEIQKLTSGRKRIINVTFMMTILALMNLLLNT
ncbi:probable leucine-rich repeat receptor-like protein kinase At2g28990 [Prosopis cineraria]|uniref:probable leucine-rich repeat receptor-like protein kinase At2g28990 n=1 Tax=Prosopis cineraria TaxID=364024 RepID=UPI002410A83E|nr:probable leucine-rich repeat receptor-like protein kinase At2g28990 [Prosopis cineraria]